ncbi:MULTISPECIES: glycosyltransferase family 4 protein [Pseudanabaena]|uniref:Glycosyl transferase group 1 n=2 Tax=Pseudanabaena TaxID=1152 RepID=L8MZB0_9CYAN|nr:MULTISPECIES: glycosyltransferase family 4 protein [Pseudanabaena]ELS31820.1 glycosyl transferase group 1 [Pseudanabaena biceps PCC 7429]MDG3495926.1 glycosyltransferase family 4 protein [Pseudanabaena catenata USMAC16]
MSTIENLRIAIVHEWFANYAGSERVVEQILNLFPKADLFAVVDFLEDSKRDFIQNKKVTTTFIQNLPFAKTKFRQYLPLMPLAIEQLDLSAYDLVISSSHAVAKGVLTGPHQLHISYVHSPIRYAWDFQHQYLKESNLERGIKSWIARWILHQMRIWDTRTANGVDLFIANSEFIARRIQKAYRRSAKVIYPPVDLQSYALWEQKQEFYLTASRLVPYKRIDLIVEAFSQMRDRQLIVIGDGEQMAKIRAKASVNIQFLGHREPEELCSYMQNAKAFVFAAEEDFGITPVEAQACGTPVIAYGRGGVRESVRGLDSDRPTGIFFAEQTAASIRAAVIEFEKNGDRILPKDCRDNALRFSTERFQREFREFVDRVWGDR